jgi:hypothetical protein
MEVSEKVRLPQPASPDGLKQSRAAIAKPLHILYGHAGCGDAGHWSWHDNRAVVEAIAFGVNGKIYTND